MGTLRSSGLRRRLRWYARVVVACVLGKLLATAVCTPLGASVLADDDRHDVLARRDDLVESLTTPEAPSSLLLDDQFVGEWRIVALSMTALATAQIAFAHPDTRAEAVTTTARLAEVALRPESRAFDTNQWGADALATLDSDDAHIGYLAHLALVLGAHRLVGGEAHATLHHAIVSALARRLERAPRPVLPTYPGETYAMDNVAMMAALGIAAVVDPLPAGDAQRARFVAYARSALLDPETGVMGFAIKGTGATPSRGSGAGWNSFYLPHVDAAFAAEQWAATARAFIVVVPPWFAALREFPHGRPGEGDVDSGPLVFGLSPAATGFAIAGARHANDAASLGGLLATAEVAGTTWVRPGRRSYLLAPDVGDAIVLAMRTARRFDRRFVAGAVAAPPP